jgi:NADH-quinone oxidoreductase subunit J
VLFLFVVMMLDVDFAELKAGFIKNAPLGLIVGGVVLAELVLVLGVRIAQPTSASLAKAAAPIPAAAARIGNTEALGRVIYTQYAYLFEAASLILFVAMIGAIVLTLRHKVGVKRQSIAAQNARTPATGMEIVKVPSGGYVIPDKAAAKGQG